ncbi:MAG: pitrilysin family protein [Polyangiaceae bacterium]
MNRRLVVRGLAALLAVTASLRAAPVAAQRVPGESPGARRGAVAQQQKKSDKKPKPDKGAAKKKPAKPSGKPGAKQAHAAPAPVHPAVPEVPPPPATALRLALSIERAKLDNGLRVVMNVDRTAPTVAVALTYDVGSRNEQRGRSGFAHLFEHMMFQGSKNLQKGEHFKLVSGHGGIADGTTSTDRTNYYQVLPANELALALWLEADRMKSLAVTADNFDNQRKVVQEEYRMRVSNVAYMPSALRLQELVYQGYWPYEHTGIGSMADLEGAKLEWVQEFFASHYAPNNAVLTIAGDFDPAEAMALVQKYFGSARKSDVPRFEEQALPEQTSQRTAVLKDSFARAPGVLYGWAIPPARHADHYALEMCALLLGEGESSRLHQVLVRDKALAVEVSAFTEDRRGPDLFTIDAKLAQGAKVGDAEKLIEAEVKALATRGPSDAELEKVRRRAQASLVLGLQSNLDRATRLGQYEVFHGDARTINEESERYLAVGKKDIERVAAQYLGPTRRTIVETYAADAAAVQAKPGASKVAGASGTAPASSGSGKGGGAGAGTGGGDGSGHKAGARKDGGKDAKKDGGKDAKKDGKDAKKPSATPAKKKKP